MILFDSSPNMSANGWSPKWEAAPSAFARRWPADAQDPYSEPDASADADIAVRQSLDAAYADGFAAAQRAGQHQAVLAEAIEKLAPLPRPELEAQLSQIIMHIVQQIFAAHAPVAAEVQNHVTDALNLLGDDPGNAKLLLHPDDAALLDGSALPDRIRVMADDSIERGTVLLDHADGRIVQGRTIAADQVAHILGTSC
jgi:flagellar biosynthesis/type III secretory pathway protein FliH